MDRETQVSEQLHTWHCGNQVFPISTYWARFILRKVGATQNRSLKRCNRWLWVMGQEAGHTHGPTTTASHWAGHMHNPMTTTSHWAECAVCRIRGGGSLALGWGWGRGRCPGRLYGEGGSPLQDQSGRSGPSTKPWQGRTERADPAPTPKARGGTRTESPSGAEDSE